MKSSTFRSPNRSRYEFHFCMLLFIVRTFQILFLSPVSVIILGKIKRASIYKSAKGGQEWGIGDTRIGSKSLYFFGCM